MKIVVFALHMVVGGSQTNAIELAAALRDLHGHDVVLFAAPGPMVELAKAKVFASYRHRTITTAFPHFI